VTFTELRRSIFSITIWKLVGETKLGQQINKEVAKAAVIVFTYIIFCEIIYPQYRSPMFLVNYPTDDACMSVQCKSHTCSTKFLERRNFTETSKEFQEAIS
jgi:hypothetical protein